MKTQSTDAELTAQAADFARKETEQLCKRAGLTKSKVFKRIKEGLDAHMVKATYDKDVGGFAYSKKLIDHGTRLKAAEMATVLLDLKPAEKKKIEFPDENGKPQKIGGLFTDMERATRLVYLLDQAAKRKKADAKRSGKD